MAYSITQDQRTNHWYKTGLPTINEIYMAFHHQQITHDQMRDLLRHQGWDLN